ncbi:MAG: hypothetical protein AAFO76_11980 [Cyanobacteria bacterium J06607_15]
MAKKRKLSDLIGEETQATETSANQSETVEVSDSKSNKITSLQTNKVTELQTTRLTESKTIELPNRQTTEVSESQADEVPKYLTLVRKEARLREDQLDSLTSLARSLNRKRKGSGERITENTLIRVAVDLLMNQSDKLQGTTEAELSASVGLD